MVLRYHAEKVCWRFILVISIKMSRGEGFKNEYYQHLIDEKCQIAKEGTKMNPENIASKRSRATKF